jgi:spore maturation protein CgeB
LVSLLKITIFGLTLSSSWGNGHATPYRAILRALHRSGARLVFYERDAPYYAAHRDFTSCDYCDLRLYSEWNAVRSQALSEAAHSDIILTASYTPQGAQINDELLGLDGPLHVFYDLDTPITLNGLKHGPLDYLRRDQIPEFDLYLSFTGGATLGELESQYGACTALPLYGCVDPDVHHRVERRDEFTCCLSYLGTYAPDRQAKLDQLFLEPARRRGESQFLLAGSMYPYGWTWPNNVRRLEHVPSFAHPGLYSSSGATLNITRREMAASGYCPSGRFFEATACGTPVLTDWWEGLETFFDLDRELAVVHTAEDVLARLAIPQELRAAAKLARCRTLEEHTGDRRASELLAHCETALQRKRSAPEVTA